MSDLRLFHGRNLQQSLIPSFAHPQGPASVYALTLDTEPLFIHLVITPSAHLETWRGDPTLFHHGNLGTQRVGPLRPSVGIVCKILKYLLNLFLRDQNPFASYAKLMARREGQTQMGPASNCLEPFLHDQSVCMSAGASHSFHYKGESNGSPVQTYFGARERAIDCTHVDHCKVDLLSSIS